MSEKDFGRPRNDLAEGSLGARIREARIAAGYKRAKDLADKIEVSQSTISQLETETINPYGKKSLATMIAIGNELQTDFGESWLAPYITMPSAGMDVDDVDRRKGDNDGENGDDATGTGE